MFKTRKLFSVSVLVIAAISMNGCATQENTGRILGGAVGAAAGSQVGDGNGRTAAIIGGAVLGAVVGGAIGSRMDDKDRRETSYALENSRTNQNTRWDGESHVENE